MFSPNTISHKDIVTKHKHKTKTNTKKQKQTITQTQHSSTAIQITIPPAPMTYTMIYSTIGLSSHHFYLSPILNICQETIPHSRELVSCIFLCVARYCGCSHFACVSFSSCVV